MPNQEKAGSATPILSFLFGGVLVIGNRKNKLVPVQDETNTSPHPGWYWQHTHTHTVSRSYEGREHMHEGEISPFHVIQNACSSCIQWIGLRENLQETMEFPIKYGVFLLTFSLKPIHWYIFPRLFPTIFPTFSSAADLVCLHGGCNGSAGSRDLGDLLNLW